MHLRQADLIDFAFNHASIGMAIVSLEGRFIQVNRALCELIGYNERELLSMNFMSIIQHDDAEEHRECFNQLACREVEAFHTEKRCVHKQGQMVWCMIVTSLVFNEKGEPIFLFAQFHDITANKLTELAQKEVAAVLKEKEESLRILMEELPLAVLITQNGVCKYLNAAALELIEADSAERYLGTSTNEIVDPCDHEKLHERRRKYRHGEKMGSVKYKVNCYNGDTKYVEGISIPATYCGEPAVIGVFQDITERKKEEERMLHSEKLSICGQLAAGVAHEIRNPLTSINGFIKLMRTLKHEKDQYYDIIEAELKSIEIICNELLLLAKPSVMTRTKTDIVRVLEQVIALMSVQATLKNCAIVAAYPQEAIWLSCDPNQIKQVFLNIIKNAIEAMHGGGNIHIDLTIHGEYAHISIQDEGCGIPPDKLQMLGQPFYTTKESGTGLGLMVSYNIIDNHGGSMSVESVPDQGTTFIISLPIMESADLY